MEENIKQHIITPLKGICNTPSDFSCDDNQTAFVKNLRYAGGELKPFQRFVMDESNYVNGKLLFIHNYNRIVRYIYQNETDKKLYYTIGGDARALEASYNAASDSKSVTLKTKTGVSAPPSAVAVRLRYTRNVLHPKVNAFAVYGREINDASQCIKLKHPLSVKDPAEQGAANSGAFMEVISDVEMPILAWTVQSRVIDGVSKNFIYICTSVRIPDNDSLTVRLSDGNNSYDYTIGAGESLVEDETSLSEAELRSYALSIPDTEDRKYYDVRPYLSPYASGTGIEITEETDAGGTRREAQIHLETKVGKIWTFYYVLNEQQQATRIVDGLKTPSTVLGTCIWGGLGSTREVLYDSIKTDRFAYLQSYTATVNFFTSIDTQNYTYTRLDGEVKELHAEFVSPEYYEPAKTQEYDCLSCYFDGVTRTQTPYKRFSTAQPLAHRYMSAFYTEADVDFAFATWEHSDADYYVEESYENIVTLPAGETSVVQEVTDIDGYALTEDDWDNMTSVPVRVDDLLYVTLIGEYTGQNTPSSIESEFTENETTSTDTSFGYFIAELNDYVQKMVSIGNTVVGLTSSSFFYLTWDGGETGYKISGSGKLPDFRFFTKYKGCSENRKSDGDNVVLGYEETDGDMFFQTDGTDSHSIVAKNIYNRDSTTCENKITAVYNELNKRIQRKKGFVNPFFVCAALHMTAGGYKYIGTPQLMMPTIGGMLWPLEFFVPGTEGTYSSAEFLHEMRLYNKAYSWLYMSQANDLSSLNVEINGVQLFDSIDIFITRPVDMWEYNNQDAWKTTANDSYSAAEYVTTTDGDIKKGTFTAKQGRGQYWGWCTEFLREKDKKQVRQDLVSSLGQFRKIASVPLKATNGIFKELSVADYIGEYVLENFDNQEQLTGNVSAFVDWAENSGAMDVFAVNRRLLTVSPVRSLANPFVYFNGLKPYKYNGTIKVSDNGTKIIYVRLRENGDKWVKTTVNSGCLYNKSLWYYHPDPRARQLVVVDESTNKIILDVDLLNGSGVGGSYYFDKDATIDENIVNEYSDTSFSHNTNDDYKETLGNQLQQSQVDNPFDMQGFSSVVYVGQKNIIGVGTLTTALSQDAYKVSTLIVFTEEGIWAVESDSLGVFKSVAPPFSREVCINKKSIVMTDDKIYFASKRGIMRVDATYENGVNTAVKDFSSAGLNSYRIHEEQPLYDYYEQINMNGSYAYDYYSNSILLMMEGEQDGFVYDIESGTLSYVDDWTLDERKFVTAVTDYPDTIIQLRDDNGGADFPMGVHPMSKIPLRHKDETTNYSGMIVSRPMKLGGAVNLKSLRRIRKIVALNENAVCTIALEGSNDLHHWSALASLYGKPWRFFRYKIEVEGLEATDSIGGLVIETQARNLDRLH